MKQYQVNINEIAPNTIVQIRGTLEFSRLKSKIEGPELDAFNQRAYARGANPEMHPFTCATITNAKIVSPADPNELIYKFINERFYTSLNQPNVFKFYAKNKGAKLPWVAKYNQSTGTAEGVTLEAELDKGLDVTLICKVFKSSRNHGLALEGVLVNGDVRYFSKSSPESILNELNITYVPAKQEDVHTEAEEQTNPFMSQAPQIPENPFGVYGQPNGQNGIIGNQGITYNPQGNRNY